MSVTCTMLEPPVSDAMEVKMAKDLQVYIAAMVLSDRYDSLRVDELRARAWEDITQQYRYYNEQKDSRKRRCKN